MFTSKHLPYLAPASIGTFYWTENFKLKTNITRNIFLQNPSAMSMINTRSSLEANYYNHDDAWKMKFFSRVKEMKKRKKFLRLPSKLKVERASAFSADVSREKHDALRRFRKTSRCQKAVKTNDNASILNGKKIIFHYVIYKNCKWPLSLRTGSQKHP